MDCKKAQTDPQESACTKKITIYKCLIIVSKPTTLKRLTFHRYNSLPVLYKYTTILRLCQLKVN